MAHMEKEGGEGTPCRTKKKPGLFRAAIFMLRRRSATKKTAKVIVNSSNDWKTLVGGMRPLHQITCPPAEFHEAAMPPPSPQRPDDNDGMSRYASAEDLQALDTSGDDNGESSEKIDERAEEFIAKFYEQIRLQRLESFNGYNDMIVQGAA